MALNGMRKNCRKQFMPPSATDQGGCLLGWQATKTVGSVCTIAFNGLKSKKRAGSTRPSSVDRDA